MVFFTDSLLLGFEAVVLLDPVVPLAAAPDWLRALAVAAFFTGAFLPLAGDLVVAAFFAAALPEALDLPAAEEVARDFRLALVADAFLVAARPLLVVFAAALPRAFPPDLSPDFAAM